MKTSVKLLITATLAVAVPAIASAAEAKDNWVKNCQKCHAADGSGQTPTGKTLKVKNYTDPAEQAKLKDEEMFKDIKEGVKNAAGRTVMPAYGEKLADDEIASLVALVRTFKKEG